MNFILKLIMMNMPVFLRKNKLLIFQPKISKTADQCTQRMNFEKTCSSRP